MNQKSPERENSDEMTQSEVSFDNLAVLKELSNIVNLVKDEEFLETVPKSKLRRVKWLPMFSCLKQGILDEMVSELSSMWEYENMHKKLDLLEKQKEKYSNVEDGKALWRPQLGDVKEQLKASDVQNLNNQKVLLESLAKEYEIRVNRLKKVVSAKRGYLIALQLDLEKYQRKTEEFFTKINEKVDNHKNFVSAICTKHIDIEDQSWSVKDIDFNEIK